MTITAARSITTVPGRTRSGMRIEAHRLRSDLRNGRRILADVSLAVEPGEVVAVIGASGAGKTTLLEILAGLRRPTSGSVHLDGSDLHRHREAFRAAVGYVPQDDIIHRDLPVDATIRHAAHLRLPGLSGADRELLVRRTLGELGMAEHASTVVARLSGGQRKRVSIAVELLTRPRVFFLDEPTSGLDPSSGRALLSTLRGLADGGSTVVLTTHSPDDVERCDRVIVLGRGGRVAFHGTPAEAVHHFGVDDVAGIYRALDDQPAPDPDGPASVAPAAPATPTAPPPEPAALPSFRHQLAVLSRRNVDVLLHNRLTLAIMGGAPMLVIAMFVVLFRPGSFAAQGGNPLAAVSITYWLAFSAFFFGLTYGLLQVVTEIAVVRREHHVGLGLAPYLMAKVVVLVPVLVVVNTVMVVALGATDRLPDLRLSSGAAVVGLLVLDAVAALALGLLASAAVADPSHATLALPMLCFPAVLFGGAVLPVRAMAGAGRVISTTTIDRWAFEAVGGVLDVGRRFGSGTGGAIVAREHGAAFTGDLGTPVLILVLSTAALLVAARRALAARTSVR